MIKLNNHVRFFVPVEPTKSREIQNHVARYLSEGFGGATEYRAVGYWVSPEGKITREPVRVIESYGDNIDNLQPLLDLAEYVRLELAQGTVAVEINGSMYIIDGGE